MSLIDDIVAANLFHAKCADNDDHACITVWSSGAQEQLEAILAKHNKPLVKAARNLLERMATADSWGKEVDALEAVLK